VTPLERVHGALSDHGSRRSGPTSWTCPAHDDRKASLSVTATTDGKVVLNCHAGCHSDAVVAALGLQWTDLFPQPEVGSQRHSTIVAAYSYVDERSRPLFEVVRFAPKDFRQRRSDGNSGWIWNLRGTRRVLYRLPRILEAVAARKTIYVAEGEKDVHALEQAGAVATCNPMGAGKWQDSYAETLAGASVIVVADRDQAGCKHARTVVSSLRAHGCTVQVVEAAEGKDAADHLDGHTLDDLVPVDLDAEAGSGRAPGPDVSGVDGAELLDRLHDTLTHFIAFPTGSATATGSATFPQPLTSGVAEVAEVADVTSTRTLAAVAATLWIAASHAQDAWEHATRLVIKSPLKRCGKSRLLDLLEALCHSPLMTVNISAAALVRSISEQDPPTILVDEADTVFAKRRGERSEQAEDMRGILNAGHQRGRPYIRWDMKARLAEHCPTFAMAALAGIGDLPDTIEDRAVIITMRRRAPGEQVTPLRRRRDLPALVALRELLHAWVGTKRAELEKAEPLMPVEDRAADTWEPLVAIADQAGGHWPALARAACKAMAADADATADGSLGERLLADLKTVFADLPAMATQAIIERLADLDEAPWDDYYGQRITARAVAKLLRPYGIRSRDVKLGGAARKGYRREDLYDAWQRYCTPSATSATSATPQANQVADGSGQARPPRPEARPVTAAAPEPGWLLDLDGPASPSGQHAYVCDRCGAKRTAFVDMAGLPHPDCPAGPGAHFRAAEEAA